MRRALGFLMAVSRAVASLRCAAAVAVLGLLLGLPSAALAASARPVTTVGPVAGLPVVSSVSPASGPLAGGTLVTITGSGFTGATAVDFGNVAGTGLVVVSDGSIIVDSPAGTGTVDVTVITAAGPSAVSTADQFSYEAAPTVTDVSPGTGPLGGGTAVTVTGTGFAGATAVDFGDVAGTGVTVNSATSITVNAPAGTGTVDVTVVTPAGTSAISAADQFTYNDGAALLTAPATYTVTGTRASLYYLAAVLYDQATGSLISGQLVTFTAGGDPVCSATTNDYGIATCSGSVSASAVRPDHGYVATFAGAPGLRAATATGALARLLGVFPVWAYMGA
jgi:IPT/TIG domain